MAPTRESNILDLVLCNDSHFMFNVNFVMIVCTSDHNFIEFTLYVSRPLPPTHVWCKNACFF